MKSNSASTQVTRMTQEVSTARDRLVFAPVWHRGFDQPFTYLPVDTTYETLKLLGSYTMVIEELSCLLDV